MSSITRLFVAAPLCAVLIATGSPAIAADENTEPCAIKEAPVSTITGTKNCLSCHDGVLAKNVASSLSGAGTLGGGFGSMRGGMHPVDIDYTAAYFKNPRRFISPQALDSRIKLDRGKVACTSCHDMESNTKNSLVMSNHRSALCLSCHAM